MFERYHSLWKQLLFEGRAHQSTVLSLELWQVQVTSIAEHVSGQVLDLGAGHLSYRDLLSSSNAAYYCLDVTKTHPELSIIADGEQLPLSDACFDTVFCSEVLEHTPHPSQMIAEIGRILVPNGRLLLFVPFIFYLHGEPHDYYRFSPYALRQLMQDHGLEIVAEYQIGGLVAFIGMSLQNVWLLLTYRVVGLGWLSWRINSWLNHVFLTLDRRLGMRSKFPLVLGVVAIKSRQS